MIDATPQANDAVAARAPGSRRKHIMHVFAPAAFGGLESVVLALASGQKRTGHHVSVVGLLETGVAEPIVLDQLREAGVPVFNVTFPARSFRAQRRALADFCRTQRPDVLHTHGYLPDTLSASLLSAVDAVRITTVHGYTGGSLRNRMYEWVQRQAFRQMNAVVAVSAKLARELGRNRSICDRIHTVPNAWSRSAIPMTRQKAQLALGLVSDEFNVAWVGRISREKGLDVMIDALAQLRDLPVLLTVIGEGRERQVLESYAAGLGVDSRIDWKGALPDASSMLAGFDLLVISSRTEGTPMVLLEAMSARLPVIATAVGGIPAVVRQTEATLVEAENAAALALAIRDVRSDPTAASIRAERARARLESDFAPGPWLDTYNMIYENAVLARRR
jgi:glycosyltransferase involved in cell wall biosynthesis